MDDFTMKKLTSTESKTLVVLLRRAIHNGQFQLAHAVPYAEFGLENDGEFEIDDTHSGCVSCSDKWLVDSAEDADSGEPAVCVYIQNSDLQFLAHGELSQKKEISLVEIEKKQ